MCFFFLETQGILNHPRTSRDPLKWRKGIYYPGDPVFLQESLLAREWVRRTWSIPSWQLFEKFHKNTFPSEGVQGPSDQEGSERLWEPPNSTYSKFKNKPIWFLSLNYEISLWQHSTVLTVTSKNSLKQAPCNLELTTPCSQDQTRGWCGKCEKRNGRNEMKTSRGNIHSPTADSAMVGFLVSLKYKSQKSNAQFTCHHPPPHFPLSGCLELSGKVRKGLTESVKRSLSPTR